MATESSLSKRSRPLDEASLAEDLGLMLASGLSITDSLKTLRERSRANEVGSLDQVLLRLQQGESLSNALASAQAAGPALVAVVRASELTGDLAVSLERFAANANRLRALQSKLLSAMVYPCLLVLVALGVILFLLIYVVPKFASVLESGGTEVTGASRVLISVGQALNAMPGAVWLALGLLGLWAATALARAARERRLHAIAQRLAIRVPGLRHIIRTFGLSRFASSCAMLVRSGVPALRAMTMCRGLLPASDAQALDRALRRASAGQPLPAALHEQALVDSLGLRLLKVAEQTGALAPALDRLAAVHERFLERTLDRVSRLIEPVLMLGIGLVVGGIVVLMYLPIFQLASSVQ